MTTIGEKLGAKLKKKNSSLRKLVSKNGDVFLVDKKVFRGRTPRDLAANHDRYLLRWESKTTPPIASNAQVEGSGTAPASIGVFGELS